MFFSPSASTSALLQQATLKPISPSGKALFSDVVKGVFNRGEGESGGIQVRSQNASKVTLVGAVTNPANSAGLFTAAVVSFRSDRSAGASEKLVLTGVRGDAATRTDVYLQETAGQPATVRVEFLDEGGSVRKSMTYTLAPFATLELPNEAPSAVVTGAVTNLSSTGSRVAARALLVDQTTGDVTDVIDWNRRNGTAPTEPQIILLAEARSEGARKSRTDLAIANLGTSTSSGRLSFFSLAQTRPRAARRRSATGLRSEFPLEEASISQLATERTITLEPGRSRLLSDVLTTELGLSDGSIGYLVYTPASGTAVLTARTYSVAASGGSAGTGVPVMASSAGLTAGQKRQFVNLEDASSETVRTAEKATFRTGFGLIESAGKAATVKVTLRYQAVVTGGLAAAQFTASREYALPARGAVSVRELARTLFGSERDKLGDLHDLIMEVAVSGGEGTVIPYTIATENGSGDTSMRIE